MTAVNNMKIFSFSLPLLLFMSVFFWIFCYYIPGFESLYYILITFWVIILILNSHPFQSKIAFLGIAIFGFYMSLISILGIYLSGNPFHAVQVSVYFVTPVLFFLLGYNSSPNHVRRILILILSIVFIFTVMERLEFWLGFNIFSLTDFSTQIKSAAIADSSDPSFGRATGIFINPNQLGFFAGCIMFSIFTLSPRQFRGRLLLLLSTAIIIFLSGSRGSIFAFLLASMIYIFLARSAWVSIGILVTGLLLYVIYFYLSSYGSFSIDAFMYRLLFDSGIEGHSMSGRSLYWSNVLDRVNIFIGTLEPPELVLGHAIDSYYMRLVAQAGIVGLLLGLFLFIFQYIEYNYLPLDYSRAEFSGLLVFVAINSISMLGLLGLEAVFVWVVFGCIARRTGDDRFSYVRRAGRAL